MILRHNLPEITRLALAAERVLDIGGWFFPLNAATHVIDIQPPAARGEPLDPENAPRFSAETWVVQDICTPPLPYPDKFFDFCFCSHTLEDVRDPIGVVREINRVARAGYVETPSRVREIFCKDRVSWFDPAPQVGFPHHRWYVELENGELVFTAKTYEGLLDRDFYLTRREVGRKLTAEESGLGLFWDGVLQAYERIVPSEKELHADFVAFKRQALARLRSA